MSNSLRPHEPQHTRPPCPSPTPGLHPNPCPLSQWCHPAISSSVIPFCSCPQSFPASGFFQMSQLSTSSGQSIEVSASTSVPPMNTQDWSPLGWTGWISLQSKGLSRVFSNTTVQKYQFFGTHKRRWIAKQSWEKNRARRITFPDFRWHYKATIIQVVWYWYKNRNIDQWDRIKSPEINPHIYGQLIYDRGGKTIQWRKESLQ